MPYIAPGCGCRRTDAQGQCCSARCLASCLAPQLSTWRCAQDRRSRRQFRFRCCRLRCSKARQEHHPRKQHRADARVGGRIDCRWCRLSRCRRFCFGARRQFFPLWPNSLTLAAVGGVLGILFMIPLRCSLIVKEHGKLPYPEGTACAEVLMVGERGGDLARRCSTGCLPRRATGC